MGPEGCSTAHTDSALQTNLQLVIENSYSVDSHTWEVFGKTDSQIQNPRVLANDPIVISVLTSSTDYDDLEILQGSLRFGLVSS